MNIAKFPRIRRQPASVILALFMGIALFRPTVAIAQGIAEESPNLMYQLFAEDDLKALDRAAHLTPEQNAAAGLLMRTGMANAMKLAMQWQQEQQDAQDESLEELTPEQQAKIAEQRAKSWKDRVKVLAEIERDVLADLRAILTREQDIEGWPAFERSRRRLLLSQSPMDGTFGQSVDVSVLVSRVKPTPAEWIKLRPVLDEYEKQLDVQITQRRSAVKRVMEQAAKAAAAKTRESGAANSAHVPDGVEDVDNHSETAVASGSVSVPGAETKPAKPILTEMQQAELAIRQLQVKTAHRVRELLEPATQAEFDKLRSNVELRTRYGYGYGMETSWISQWTKAIHTLTPDQLQAIKDLKQSMKAQIVERWVKLLAQQDAAVLAGENVTPSRKQQVEDSKFQRQTYKKLTDDLKAILTPDQLAELGWPGFFGAASNAASDKAFKRPRGINAWDYAGAEEDEDAKGEK